MGDGNLSAYGISNDLELINYRNHRQIITFYKSIFLSISADGLHRDEVFYELFICKSKWGNYQHKG